MIKSRHALSSCEQEKAEGKAEGRLSSSPSLTEMTRRPDELTAPLASASETSGTAPGTSDDIRDTDMIPTQRHGVARRVRP